MTGAIECRYYGRDFTTEEMALLRALIAAPAQLSRHALSKEFCRRIGWRKPDGGLKDMMARVTLLAMHRDRLIALPPPRWQPGRPRPIVFGPDTEPPLFPAPSTLDEVRPLQMGIAVRGTREGKLWNEFVARYHYLGYTTLVGAQMRYAVHDRNGAPLAMLGFSTAAWKLAPRDHFIGWTPERREKNLPLVVDNPRFLILPWVTIPNLGSHILALVRRRALPGGKRRRPPAPRRDAVDGGGAAASAGALPRLRFHAHEVGGEDQHEAGVLPGQPPEVEAVDDQLLRVGGERVQRAQLDPPPIAGVETGLDAPDPRQPGHGLAHSGAEAGLAQAELLDHPGERVLELGLREALGLRLPELRFEREVGLALRFEQRGPVPPLEQGLRLLEVSGLRGVVAVGGVQPIELDQDAVDEEDAEDQPHARAQPGVAGELRRERPQRAAKRPHPRTLSVISSRFSLPSTAGSARTCSKSGSASRART